MITEKIQKQIAETAILLYMKGTPYEPQCGFSAKTVQCLVYCETEFAYVDILEDPEVRAELPNVSDWPTFPQLFVKGELIGGCDIVSELYVSGELADILA